MKNSLIKTGIVCLFGCLIMLASCNPNQSTQPKTTQDEDRMAWWRDARFGMFIHWGLYAVPAGEWKGEKIPGISEWIMLRARIPVDEYEALAKEFNPVNYNADEWVSLAKAAGMKYIVITSKHHDGFAMFHSKANPYNIVDATPFDRDPLKELADACRKYGIKLGFYHSQAQDWNHPGGTYRNMDKEPHWDPAMKRVSTDEYVDEKVIPQVKELLTNYGDLAIFWWDTPYFMTEEQGNKLLPLLELQPGIVANNRLVRGWKGDFSTPEQHIPPGGLDYDWEVCMTMNTSWGYKHYDDNWKSTKDLVRNLIDIASKGGNYLLNVGPNALGEIPGPSIERLTEIGEWMDKNGASIYGTSASPFFKLHWGRCTKKETKKGNLLYLHVFDWPQGGELIIPGLKSSIKKAYLLDGEQKLKVRQGKGNTIVQLPTKPVDDISSTIVLEIRGELLVESNMPAQDENGQIFLPAIMSDINNPGYGIHAELSEIGKDAYIHNWKDERARISWVFSASEPGEYKVEIMAGSASDSNVVMIKCGEETIQAKIPATGTLENMEKLTLANVHLEEGQNVIELDPIKEGWSEVNLQYVLISSITNYP